MIRNRWLLAAAMAGTLFTSVGWSQDQLLDELYGRGVHAYFARNYEVAHASLTEAVTGGSQDPRVYFYRALAYSRLGRPDEARADFERGAALEVAAGDVYPVGKSLERVQGADRSALESYRRNARLAARTNQNSRERVRVEETRRIEGDVLRNPGRGSVAPAGAIGPAPNDPFGPGAAAPLPAPPPPAPVDPAPVAPAPVAPAPAGDPFGAPAPAAPAPAPGPAPVPAPAPADPFGGPAPAPAVPAPAPAPADPFGGPPPAAPMPRPMPAPMPAAPDPFGGPAAPAPMPAAPDPFGGPAPAPAPAPAGDPFGAAPMPAAQPRNDGQAGAGGGGTLGSLFRAFGKAIPSDAPAGGPAGAAPAPGAPPDVAVDPFKDDRQATPMPAPMPVLPGLRPAPPGPPGPPGPNRPLPPGAETPNAPEPPPAPAAPAAPGAAPPVVDPFG